MKFDTAYCISLDDKLSIYDVRDLNFDETMAFDSAKEQFQCPNDACRAAFAADNQLGTFNAKNVNYIRTPHFKNLPGTRHIEGCPYGTSRTLAAGVEGTEDDREEHFPSELLLARREYVRKPASPAADSDTPGSAAPAPPPACVRRPRLRPAPQTRPVSSLIRWNVLCRISTTRSCSSACR